MNATQIHTGQTLRQFNAKGKEIRQVEIISVSSTGEWVTVKALHGKMAGMVYETTPAQLGE